MALIFIRSLVKLLSNAILFSPSLVHITWGILLKMHVLRMWKHPEISNKQPGGAAAAGEQTVLEVVRC